MFCKIRNKAKEGRSFGNTLKRKEGRSLGNGGSICDKFYFPILYFINIYLSYTMDSARLSWFCLRVGMPKGGGVSSKS